MKKLRAAGIRDRWDKKHATVMILGDVHPGMCVRNETGMPRLVDPMEPENVAIAAGQMGFKHRHYGR